MKRKRNKSSGRGKRGKGRGLRGNGRGLQISDNDLSGLEKLYEEEEED